MKANRITPLLWIALLALLAACGQLAEPTPAPTADMPSVSAQAVGDYVVNSLADPGDGTCNASNCTLREAIAAAVSGNTITFGVNGNIRLTSSLTIPSGKDLTIDATGRNITLNGQNAVQVLENNANLTLTNLTITGGKGTSTGGGILNNIGNTLTLNNSTVSGNSAGRGGGIFNNLGGTLTLNNSTVSRNSASAGEGGGGIYNGTIGILTLNNSTVSGNSATDSGGGIFNNFGALTLNDSTVSRNSAGRGGGIYNSGRLTLENSTMHRNSAVSGSGGGIHNAAGILTLNNSTFTDNTTPDRGGAVHSSGSLTATNSTFDDNTAGFGSAIESTGTQLTVTNSTFTGNTSNSSSFGGTITNRTSIGTNTLVIVNNTFVGNSKSTNSSPAIGSAFSTDGSASITLKNNLFADRGVNCSSLVPFSGSSSNNLATDSSCPGSTLKTLAELRLGPLANNGGPTRTIALRPGSAAIDAGDNAAATSAGLSTDQRGAGFPRIFNSQVDVGAFEIQEAAVCRAGSYNSSSRCVPADPGFYVAEAGATQQTPCEPGKYQPKSGKTSCIPADPGFFVDLVGAIQQFPCLPGKYQPDSGQTSCIEADPGFYVPKARATAQIRCPTGTTSDAGATACTPIPVTFNFKGFFQPVGNLPILNTIKTGAGVSG